MKSTIITSSGLSSIPKQDHRRDIDKHFALYQGYTDVISAIKTDKNKTEHIKKTVCAELETRNLHVSEIKIK